MFITGAPCQAYSTAGRGAGLDDGKNRGVTIFYSLDYVRCKRPKVVVVENVRGLTFKKHQHILNDIIGVMKQLGYLTTWRVLNTRHHGIPQSRPRLYIVGIREDTCAHTFHWPWSASPLLEHRQPLQQIQHQRSEHNNAGKRAFLEA